MPVWDLAKLHLRRRKLTVFVRASFQKHIYLSLKNYARVDKYFLKLRYPELDAKRVLEASSAALAGNAAVSLTCALMSLYCRHPSLASFGVTTADELSERCNRANGGLIAELRWR